MYMYLHQKEEKEKETPEAKFINPLTLDDTADATIEQALPTPAASAPVLRLVSLPTLAEAPEPSAQVRACTRVSRRLCWSGGRVVTGCVHIHVRSY